MYSIITSPDRSSPPHLSTSVVHYMLHATAHAPTVLPHIDAVGVLLVKTSTFPFCYIFIHFLSLRHTHTLTHTHTQVLSRLNGLP